MDNTTESPKKVKAFLDAGSEIAGSAAGAALGVVIGGIPGSVAGSAIGPLATQYIRTQVNDFAERFLSSGQKQKVAAVLDYAAEEIQRKLKIGYEVRHDDFFRGSPGNRSIAEELAEGVLIAAQQEHEERKLQYLGYFMANLAFHPEINRATANLLLQQAQSLTYRQLVLLAMLSSKDSLGIAPGLLKSGDKVKFDSLVYLQEIYDLYRRGLAYVEGGGYMLDVATLSPGSIVIRGPGNVLFRLMELNRIPRQEVLEIADEIKARTSPSQSANDSGDLSQ